MHGPAQLLEDDAHVDHAHAGAALLLWYQESGDTELGQAFPDGLGRAAGVTQQVAHVRLDRRLLGEEAADGGPERLLLL